MTVRTDPRLALVHPVTPRTPGCEECPAAHSARVRWCLVHEAFE
ncbi:hypothetical protein [Streptomyces thermocarboxydovorans]